MEDNKIRINRTISFYATMVFLITIGIRGSSCSAPKIQPYSQVVEMPTKDLQKGRASFNEYCATCHPGGMSGVGPAIINKPLPKALIRFQIRNGVGLMPAFGENQLSDKAVKNIAEYLVFLREKD